MNERNQIISAAMVPGLPHLLLRDINPTYAQLASAMDQLGDRLARLGVTRVLYYSTQWLSVLGHSVQARVDLSGSHVDENWHDLPDLPFCFRVDRPFAEKLVTAMEHAGYQTRLIDYDGFPVDTGTIVADSMINRGRFAVGMLSCSVYSDYADTKRLATTLRHVLNSDPNPTAVVCVSALSGRWITHQIDLREDHFSAIEDDGYNRRLIDWIEQGNLQELATHLPGYCAAAKADMGMKALAVLEGIGALIPGRHARCHAYGPIYGTGAAVIEW